jgi:NAD-dependent dihydropyrimidine dehydrogenase PreA subunit
MNSESFSRNRTQTAYIRLDTGKCTACWICQEKCPKNVIGRINLLWHKHARIIDGNNCIGCFLCIKLCKSNALSKV